MASVAESVEGEKAETTSVTTLVDTPNAAQESDGSDARIEDCTSDAQQVVNEQELKYWKAVKENPSDFTSWTYLLQFVEQENKLSSARKAFDAFFKRYPYCYGYWKKYADLERKNGNTDKAKEVFESGVAAIPLSVDLWVHYLNFASQTTKGQPDGPQVMRSLFEAAVLAAGEEFRPDKLWEAYIDWEKSQGQLQEVTKLYDRVFTIPTQNYCQHFEKFKEHINSNPVSDTLSTEELLKLRAEVAAAPPGVASAEAEPLVSVASTAPPGLEEESSAQAEATESLVAPGEEAVAAQSLMNDVESVAIREKVIAARMTLFAALEEEVRKRWTFEEAVKRPYFHVKPLERMQLKNWRDYLDFEIASGSHDRVVTLFERCVIACALYEDFWQRFASYMEEFSLEGCRGVYERACTIHLPRKSNIHLAWAAFEEEHENAMKASQILADLDAAVPGQVIVKLRRINVVRRLGDLDMAAQLYEEAIQGTSDSEVRSFYSIRYARFLAKLKKDAIKANQVLRDAIEKDKDNKRLYLQLLDVELNAFPVSEEAVELVFNLAENSDLPVDVKQGFSQRRLEFLEDFSCSVEKIRKAQEAHAKAYKVKTGIASAIGKRRTTEEGVVPKPKLQKTEGAVPDSSQQVTGTVPVGTEAYDQTYSSAYTAAASGYTYPAPTQSQWAAYSGALAGASTYNYNQWYQQYGAAYGQPHQTATQ